MAKLVDVTHGSLEDDPAAYERCTSMFHFIERQDPDDPRFEQVDAWLSERYDYVPGTQARAAAIAGAINPDMHHDAWMSMLTEAICDDGASALSYRLAHDGEIIQCVRCKAFDHQPIDSPNVLDGWHCSACDSWAAVIVDKPR